MKKLHIILFLLSTYFVCAQNVYIPNVNFKSSLISASGGLYASTQTPIYNPISQTWEVSSYDIIDTNGDGEIQVSEAQAIKYLSVTSSPGNQNITDLTGIESFTNLLYLSSRHNFLTSINLTQNVALKGLELYGCGFYDNLNLSQNVNLITLYCNYNALTNLNLTNNINLEYLDCSSNFLTNLNLSQNVNLKYLFCHVNELTNLNVSGLTNMKRLITFNNNLTNLNLSNLSSLEDFMCSSNEITSLDISDLTNLKYLQCDSNFLTDLDVSQNSNLNYLACGYNQIDNLNLSGLSNLEELNCSNNLLTTLDVSNSNSLIKLWCSNNQLTWLNIKNGNAGWGILDFLMNPSLNYVCCDDEDVVNVQQQMLFYDYPNCHVNSYCSFTPGGTFYDISGNTKFDSNNNGCEITDIIYPNLNFSITNGTNTGSIISNLSGNYNIAVSDGSHTITPNLENPTYFNVLPTNFSVNFPSQISPFIQNFCIVANGVHSNVEVVLIATTPARPGFDANYKLIYQNKGNQVENGTVSFSMYNPDKIDFVSSLPNFNNQTINPILETFTWNYSNLNPFETREIDIVLNINSPMETPPVNSGDVLRFDAQISLSNTDDNLSDNFFALRQRVVNSYDPNDKTCLQGETITPIEVGEYVHYVIRFENTGTFPAQNIVIKDIIDLDKFDIATLIPFKSSHDFYTRINGNKLEFIFENINLDFSDASNDGYVVFKIKTKSTLVLGDTFTNNANIYFDYNFPITTNTYTTTVAALNSKDFKFETYFNLYPNPVIDTLSIQTKEDLEINSIEIYNQLGQIILAVTNFVNKVDVADLESGTYYLKVNTKKGNTCTKFIKQ